MKKVGIIDLWRNLAELFKLSEHTPAEFLFQETIVPTIDTFNLVGVQDSIDGAYTVSGPGATTIITVPTDEMWFIDRGHHELTGTPTCTIGTVLYPLGSVANAIYFMEDMVTTGTALREQIYFYLPLILEPTDEILSVVTPYTAGGPYTLRLRGKKLKLK